MLLISTATCRSLTTCDVSNREGDDPNLWYDDHLDARDTYNGASYTAGDMTTSRVIPLTVV